MNPAELHRVESAVMTGAPSNFGLDREAEPKATSDTHLIRSAQQGDEAAFAALFNMHKRRVYSLCLRMTRDATEAEDLCQEAFLQVFRRISTFRSESKFSTWLHRVAVNVVLMHLRKKSRQPIPLVEIDISQEQPDEREYGEDDWRLLGTVDRISLERAIQRLPRGYRTAFVLFDVEGLEHTEIAEMMNWSVGNSKSQLHKARLKLRELLRSGRGRSTSRRSATEVSLPNKRKRNAAGRELRKVGAGSKKMLYESTAL